MGLGRTEEVREKEKHHEGEWGRRASRRVVGRGRRLGQ